MAVSVDIQERTTSQIINKGIKPTSKQVVRTKDCQYFVLTSLKQRGEGVEHDANVTHYAHENIVQVLK